MILENSKEVVTGTYNFLEGDISAVINNKKDKNMLVGSWTQSNNSGWFRFTMNPGNDSFSGTWGYKDNQETAGNWSGYRSEGIIAPVYEVDSENISYKESLQKWEDLKKEKGDSYIYEQKYSSWVGFGHTTQITVKQGVVVSRSYESFKINDNGEREITKSYTETEKNIGKNEEGAPAITMDQLYKDAKKHLDVNSKKNTIIFSTFNNGILMTCGYIPKGCADDCFNGVSLSGFTWID